MGVFLQYLLWGHGVKIHKIIWPWWLSFPGVFTSRLVHTESLQFIKYSSGVLSLALVLTEISILVKCNSLYLPFCLHNLGTVVCPVMVLLWWIQDFSVCWAFCWLEQSDNFQVSYMLDWKSFCGFYCGCTVKHFQLWVVGTFSPDWTRISLSHLKLAKHFFKIYICHFAGYIKYYSVTIGAIRVEVTYTSLGLYPWWGN